MHKLLKMRQTIDILIWAQTHEPAAQAVLEEFQGHQSATLRPLFKT